MIPLHWPRALLRHLIGPLFIALYGGLSVYLIAVFLVGSALIDDNGRVPEVQHRPLIHALSQGLIDLVPPTIEKAATQQLIVLRETPTVQGVLQWQYENTHDFDDRFIGHVSDRQIFGTAVKLAVVYATLCLFLWMLYRLAMVLFPQSRAYALLAPILAGLVLACLVREYAYSYDFAELFFCCMLLYWLRLERFGRYLFFLALGTLNKETVGFSIVFFAVWFLERLPPRRYFALLVAQAVIYLSVRTILASLYGPYEYPYRFPQHLYSWYQFDSLSLVVLLGMAALITFRWRDKPLFLRYSLWMVVPNAISYLMVVPPAEYRGLYWSLPTMVLLATHTLVVAGNVAEAEVFARDRLDAAGSDLVVRQ